MRRRSAPAWLLALSLLAPPLTTTTTTAQQRPAAPSATAPVSPAESSPTATTKDPNDPIEKIKDEGLNRSQVMKTLWYLTDVIGPRLTGSPNMKRANEWTRTQLTEWGLQNGRLEAWGPFGRGWSLEKFSAQVLQPQYTPLIAYPKAWSPGTSGPLTGAVVYVNANTVEELERFRGKLKGAIVLNGPVRELKAHFEPEGTRLTDQELLALADAPDPAVSSKRREEANEKYRATRELAARRIQFYTEEGAALIVDPSRGGDGGTVFVQQAIVPFAAAKKGERTVSAWDVDAPLLIPQIVVSGEQYNRLARLSEQGEKVQLSVDLAVRFHTEDLMGYNTVAEIPGTDLKDEVVMLGAHLDSWHGGTGATDNAAGVAVVMEAVRLLQALKLQPRRTIRVALWSGEEQGLYGSRAYVAQHFGVINEPAAKAETLVFRGGQTASVTLKPAAEKFSAYFNLDNGTGRIRGVYLQGNEAVRPIFRAWLEPFREMGAATLSIANTGGTDHLPFNAIGLPGFQFIQDEIEYETRTHHSNQDVYDRIQAGDMKQAAVIMAAFVYQTAMREEKLPRKKALNGT